MNYEERRLTGQLLKYWDDLRGERLFPNEDEINPTELDDIWEHCFLVNVKDSDPSEGYRYNYLGDNLIGAYGDNLTKEEAAKLMNTTNPEVTEKIQKVVETKAPVVDENEFSNSKNVIIRYREILLPVGGEGDAVDYVLGGMRWRQF